MDVMSEQLQGLLHAVHQQEILERDSTEHIQEETTKQESESSQHKIRTVSIQGLRPPEITFEGCIRHRVGLI